MKKFIYIIAIVCVCLLLCGDIVMRLQSQSDSIDLAEINPARLPYGYVGEHFQNGGNPVYPVDWNGDGCDEILIAELPNRTDPNHYGLLLKTWDDETINTKTLDVPINITELQEDLDGDGYVEICYSSQRDDTLFYTVWNVKTDTQTVFEIARNKHRSNRPWKCIATLIGARDITADGCKEVIIYVFTSEAYLPRAIMAWDWRHKKLVWSYAMGAYANSAFICDYDHDGEQEVVCGTNSPNNGLDAIGREAVINETSDSEGYFLTIDLATGKREVLLPIGYAYESVQIYPFDRKGDGTEDVMIVYSGKRDSLRCGWIAPWNAETNSLELPLVQIKGDDPHMFLAYDIDDDGLQEYLTAWKSGILRVYRQDRSLIHEIQLGTERPFEISRENVAGDDEDEIIIRVEHAGRFLPLLLNKQLKCIAFNNTYIPDRLFFHLTPGGYARQAATSDEGGVVLGLERQPWSFLPFAGHVGEFIQGAIVTIFSVLLVLLFIRPRYRLHDMRTIFNTLYHNDDTGYLLVEKDGRIRTANPLFLQWIGRAGHEVLKRHAAEALEESAFSWLVPHLVQFIKDDVNSITFEQQSSNNHYYVVKLISMPFPVLFTRMVLVVIEDVSEFVQSKRTVAWASMAQKLAHEIKTPLSTVLLSAQQIGEDSTSGKYVRHIREQVERLQSLTEDMLKFAHIEKPRLERVDINDVVRQALQELRLQIGSAVHVETAFAKELPELMGDPHQIAIAVKNCIRNSLTAMQGKGTISLYTRVTGPAGSFNVFGHSLWTEIEIVDTGSGMTREELDMLFQPFFSHSPKGTGLGMVIVKKIIDDHHGTISVSSKEGEGTSIKITLPGRPDTAGKD